MAVVLLVANGMDLIKIRYISTHTKYAKTLDM